MARKKAGARLATDSDVLRAILGQMQQMNERFERMDERFERMDERFERMDERFVELGGRLDAGFEALSDGVRETNARLDLMNVQLGSITRLTQRHESRLGALERPRKRA